MLSPSSIEKVVDAVSSGSLKSLSGLDNEDVEKGHNHFKSLHEFAKILCRALRKSDSETEGIVKRLTDAQVFTETSFKEHVKEHGEHICQCLSCGFTSDQGCTTCTKVPAPSKAKDPSAEKCKNKASKPRCKHPGCNNQATTKKRGLCARHDKELRAQNLANHNQ